MNEEESILGLIFKKCEDEKRALSEAVVQGNVGDFAAYKLLTGKIHGLALAQSIINEVADTLRRQSE